MPCLRHSSGALTPARASFNTAMICSSVCRFRIMGLLLSAHHSTVELPSQWCTFQGEGQHMPKERVKSYADRALAVTPKGQWYLAVWIAREALFANDLAEKNFDAALNSGLEYVRSEVAASALREEGEERWDISGYGNFDSNELSPEVLNKW